MVVRALEPALVDHQAQLVRALVGGPDELAHSRIGGRIVPLKVVVILHQLRPVGLQQPGALLELAPEVFHDHAALKFLQALLRAGTERLPLRPVEGFAKTVICGIPFC